MPKYIHRLLGAFLFNLLFAILPLLILWNSNLGQVSPASVINSLWLTLAYAFLVFMLWLFLVRKPEKAAVLSAVSSVFVFSYGHLFNLVSPYIGYARFFLLLGAVFAVLLLLVLRTRRVMLPSFLFLPLIVLLLWNAGSIARFTIETRPPKAQIVESAAMGQSSGNDLPDIYYIVLDAYARQDILKQVIGLDNAPFLGQLKERGFYIPACAFSNYDGTISTIASVLNYDTLENLGVESSASGAYQAPNINLIQDNAASKVFRSYGYQFVTGRGYAPFNDIQSSDLYLNYAVDQGIKDELSEKRFTSLYLNTTVFRFLVELQKNNPYRFSQLPAWLAFDQAGDPYLEEATFWYWQNNYMFDSLEKLPEKPGSFFVYAHINAPHGPYVYRADGSFRYPLDDKDEKELYADAVIYLNQRVIRLVDALIQKSDPAPIIIIQADHGIHKLTAGIDKHKILSAYYLPGSLTTPPYDTITPVNNFRLILRNYFDPEMQLLPDILWTKEINQYQAVPANCSLNR